MPEWITTSDVAAAAGVSGPTVLRWARAGVLPRPTVVYGGARGRTARWAPESAPLASWVRSKLDEGYTFDEIKLMPRPPL